MRAAMNQQAVNEYAEALKAGARFHPVVVFEDDHSQLLLSDGFHRIEAHIKAGFREITARIYPGDRVAALKHAFRANNKHGVRRTNADKRRAVEVALREFPELSTHEIASMTEVSQAFVSIYSRKLRDGGSSPKANELPQGPEPSPKGNASENLDPKPQDVQATEFEVRANTGQRRRRKRVKPSPLALAQLMIMVVAKLKHAGLDESPAVAQWEEACNQLYALAGKEVQEMGGSGQKSARRLIRRLLTSIEIVAAATPDGAVVTEAIDALLRDLEAPTGAA